MIGVSKSNRALVEAIVACFRDPPRTASLALAPFSPRDWQRTEAWLDLSGLALYFLEHLRANGVAEAIDPRVRGRLEEKLADNRLRVADLTEEFLAINRSFSAAGLRYANLKGLTLSPDSCLDPSLRHQSDYDFLVDPKHLSGCRSLLQQRGYAVTGSTPRTLEMKTVGEPKITLDGRYKPKNRRAAELHIAIESVDPIAADFAGDERLNRLGEFQCGGQRLPALGSADQLIGQALHLLGHFRDEHTRPSWLLEYRRHVMVRHGDKQFWKEVRELAAGHPDAAIALGLSTILASDLFGPFSFPELDSWTRDVLPVKVAYWAGEHGRRAVLADVPGTKLYRLLDAALQENRPPPRKACAGAHSFRYTVRRE